MWQKEYESIPGLLESDIQYNNFVVRRNNVSCIKRIDILPDNKKILIKCNYEDMGKIFAYGIDDETEKFVSDFSVTVYFKNGGYFDVSFNHGFEIASPIIRKNNNLGYASFKEISDYKYEIQLIKNISHINIYVHFYGNHEISKKHFLELCKKSDLKIEII